MIVWTPIWIFTPVLYWILQYAPTYKALFNQIYIQKEGISKLMWNLLGKMFGFFWILSKMEGLYVNEDTKVNTSYTSNEIKPLPKVDESAMKKFLKNNIFLRINRTLNHKGKIENAQSVKEKNESLAYNYISRFCQNSECRKHQNIISCINNCIFPNANIIYYLLDDSFIYYYSYSKNQKKLIMTPEDIQKLLTYYDNVSDKKLMEIFRVNETDLSELKSHLIFTSFRNIIDKFFSEYTPQDIIRIIQLLLQPNGKILNPIAFWKLMHSVQLQFKPGETYDDIHKKISSSKNIRDIPEIYLKENKMTYDTLQSILFPNSVDAFLTDRFSKSIPTQIHNLLCYTKFFVKNLVGLKQEEYNTALYHIARFLYYKRLSVFNLYPTSIEELMSLFYCHRTQFEKLEKPSNPIYFISLPVKLTHHIAAQRLLVASHMAFKTIAQHSTINEKLRAYEKLEQTIYQRLGIAIKDPDELTIDFERFISPNTNISYFTNLRRVLYSVTKGNINDLESLLTLIAKSYLGNSLYEDITGHSTKQLTIISCNNPAFISAFLKEIFFCQITEYSLKTLATPSNLSRFIDDKMNGKLANIDTTEINFAPENIGWFIELAKGRKVNTRYKMTNQNQDKLTAQYKITHRSTIQYIYITKNAIYKKLSNIPHHAITLLGDIGEIEYQSISSREALTFAVASVCWLINKYASPKEKDKTLKEDIENFLLPDKEDAVEQFIENFCINRTSEIPENKINKIDKRTIEGSKNEFHKLDIAKELNITSLPFTISSDFSYVFKIWYRLSFNKIFKGKDKDITNILKDKLHPIFYLKKRKVTYQFGNKEGRETTGTRGFYGIKIKKDVLQFYIKEIKIKKEDNNVSAFNSYFDNLINETLKYIPSVRLKIVQDKMRKSYK
ncbi:hypothetical protein [Megasphaera sueciensis]|uniref:hypothetical protein n=1 Tax=Megasphaera sueciensis TaxID=349094 RepID=UPI003D01A528